MLSLRWLNVSPAIRVMGSKPHSAASFCKPSEFQPKPRAPNHRIVCLPLGLGHVAVLVVRHQTLNVPFQVHLSVDLHLLARRKDGTGSWTAKFFGVTRTEL